MMKKVATVGLVSLLVIGGFLGMTIVFSNNVRAPDIAPPVITNHTAEPDPQNIGGFVNISALVVDDVAVYGAWVDISGVGNNSMTYDSPSGRYSYNDSYAIANTYPYTIWANDTSDNWTSASGSFEIRDMEPPAISDVPSMVWDVDVPLNITANVTDDIAVDSVWIIITGPSGGNFSMIKSTIPATPDLYYYNSTYSIVGVYEALIRANDTSDNWGMYNITITIMDMTPPEITDVTVNPNPQNIGGYVNISANITDNSIWMNLTADLGVPDGWYAMSYDTASERFYLNRTYQDGTGTFDFEIKSYDPSGNLGYYSGQFTIVDDIPPIADAGFDKYLYEHDTIELDGSMSTDNVGIDNYTWTFTYDGDLVTFYADKFAYTFDIEGDYEITLTVWDSDGNSDTDTVWIYVELLDGDNDGLRSWEEVEFYGTDPDDPDSDDDGMPDGWEVTYILDPLNASDASLDLDGDGLSNLEEYFNNTIPNNDDTDGDQLSDGAEIIFFETDPTDWDTDGDGIGDAIGLDFSAIVELLPYGWIGMTITWSTYTIYVKTNSSVLGATFDKDEKTLSVTVSGPDGTTGACVITVPKGLIESTSAIFVEMDDEPLEFELSQNDTHYTITINYTHSTHDLTTDLAYTGGTTPGGADDNTIMYMLVAVGIIAVIVVALSASRRKRPEEEPEEKEEMDIGEGKEEE